MGYIIGKVPPRFSKPSGTQRKLTQPKTALIYPVIFDSLPQLSHSMTTFGEIIHGVRYKIDRFDRAQ